MKTIIATLLEDHKKLEEKISDTKRLMTLPPEESFSQVAKNLAYFQDFTFNGLHERENEIINMWMEQQSHNTDMTIMNRLKNDHQLLAELGNKIHSAITNYLKRSPDTSNVAILSDLNKFIGLYLKHIEEEEKFISMISNGLHLSKEEKEIKLKEMRQSL